MAVHSKGMRDNSTRYAMSKVEDLLHETAEDEDLSIYKNAEAISTDLGLPQRIYQSYGLSNGEEEVEFEIEIFDTLETVEDMQGVSQKSPVEKLKKIHSGRLTLDGNTRVVYLSPDELSDYEEFWDDFNQVFEYKSMSDSTMKLNGNNYHLYSLP